jgi:hypothetical protein
MITIQSSNTTVSHKYFSLLLLELQGPWLATAAAAGRYYCWLPAGEHRIVLSLAVSSVPDLVTLRLTEPSRDRHES